MTPQPATDWPSTSYWRSSVWFFNRGANEVEAHCPRSSMQHPDTTGFVPTWNCEWISISKKPKICGETVFSGIYSFLFCCCPSSRLYLLFFASFFSTHDERLLFLSRTALWNSSLNIVETDWTWGVFRVHFWINSAQLILQQGSKFLSFFFFFFWIRIICNLFFSPNTVTPFMPFSL